MSGLIATLIDHVFNLVFYFFRQTTLMFVEIGWVLFILGTYILWVKNIDFIVPFAELIGVLFMGIMDGIEGIARQFATGDALMWIQAISFFILAFLGMCFLAYPFIKINFLIRNSAFVRWLERDTIRFFLVKNPSERQIFFISLPKTIFYQFSFR